MAPTKGPSFKRGAFNLNLGFRRNDLMKLCYYSSLILGYGVRMRFERMPEDQKSDGLSEVDVDKTMRLLDKVWEVRPNKDARQSSGLLVDFCVNRDYNDKH